ncbi:uncharacterized protein LOC122275463 isoform X2 [Carya illinoinensis]|uniref:uncharacterized protein LOC122275463 isoform X2 n=1 Tax=Carya illinoinensis TaxID=32201 RepID=UPI001C722EBA|nr:uncharacterized protein LOC122275463 isoform X2 [Carya illinoinensis]
MQSNAEKLDIASKHKKNVDLYRALLDDKTKKVKKECARFDEHALQILTIHDDTVLHAATYAKQSRLVLDLLEALPSAHLDRMTRQNHQGNTILHDAATSEDNLDVAKKVFEKAPGLLCMRNHLGETALFRSVRYGNKKIFNFLAEKIDGYKEDHTKQLFLQRSDKTTILHVAILAQHFAKRSRSVDKSRYDSALKLAKFLIERDFSWEATYPAIDQSKPRLHKYGGAPSVDRGVGQGPQLMSTALGQGDQPETATPLFLATKSGCVDIAEKILEVYPQAVEHIDDKGRNILHVAIKYRQEKIFQLVQKLELPMKRLVRKVDNDGNSILHTVGIKVEDYTPEELRGPAYQLREEMQWFELVYTVTPPHFRDHRNNMNLTAEGLFYKANNELRTAATDG